MAREAKGRRRIARASCAISSALCAAATSVEALDELASFGTVPRFDVRRNVPSDFGKVYFLAGRVDDSLPYLKTAAAMCDALEVPVRQTVAHDRLGRALESKGDRDGGARAGEAAGVREVKST